MNRSTKQCLGVLGLALVTGTADAQEMFSVNLFAYGRNLADEWQLESWREVVRIEGTDADTTAGVWETSNWENIEINSAVNPINGDGGSTANFEIITRRNQAPYWWAGIDPGSGTKVARDYSTDVDSGNATLLDAHVNSTQFDGASGTGVNERPFGWQIADYEIRDIPFATYDIVLYFGVSQGQDYSGIGNYRTGADIVRPTDASNWKNETANPEFKKISEGGTGISDANATQFTLPQTNTAPGGDFTPTGELNDISDDGIGNYIIIPGLTDSTFNLQTWGDAFTHLGLAGFQIREATTGPLQGDFDGDGDVDGVDVAELFSNFNGPGGGTPTNPDTDLDGDGDADGVDVATLFGLFTGPLAPATVPEPTSLALLGLGGLLVARQRR